MDRLIEAEHLNRVFNEKPAVDDLSFYVEAGEIYGLVGPDGAGKTTTLRLLCGAYRPTLPDEHQTTIRIAGMDMLSQTELARSEIGYLSQRFSLYEDLTVLENIRFFAEIRGLSSSEWLPLCMETLEFVGLADFIDRRAGQLSGGMKQKLGLASALVTRPRVLLLDEPTTGVDPVTRQDFWQLIIRLAANPLTEGGVCVLISTPYMDEAARCHRVGFMRQGKMIKEGTPGQLRLSLEGQIIELRGEPVSLLKEIALREDKVADVRTFGDKLHLRLKESISPVIIEQLKEAMVQGGGRFVDARPIPATLEDVFIALTNREE